MKYHAFMFRLWAFLSSISIGVALMFVGFGEGHNAWFACAFSLVTGILGLVHAELSKPKSWSGPYCK